MSWSLIKPGLPGSYFIIVLYPVAIRPHRGAAVSQNAHLTVYSVCTAHCMCPQNGEFTASSSSLMHFVWQCNIQGFYPIWFQYFCCRLLCCVAFIVGISGFPRLYSVMKKREPLNTLLSSANELLKKTWGSCLFSGFDCMKPQHPLGLLVSLFISTSNLSLQW